MTTIAIKLPLVDERACTGCPCINDMNYGPSTCRAFPTRLGPKVLSKSIRIDGYYRPRRLPECLAAQVEEADHG